MEQMDFCTMKPTDTLTAGSTKWVLANPGKSYIAYTYDYEHAMCIKNMTAGYYTLMWFDTVTCGTITNNGVSVTKGDAEWWKPDFMGKEIALYDHRSGSHYGKS
jgi:hypothetical protein